MYRSKTPLALIGLKAIEKKITFPFNPVYFIVSIVKSFEILLKGSASSFISESFASSWDIFVALTNKLLFLPL